MDVDSSKTVANWNDVKVDYIWRLEDGTVFDSSIEACAKLTKNYKDMAGRTFEPLEFVVWEWRMIKWFDEWVVWMKLWESKKLVIPPEKAYGWEYTTQTIPKKYFEDTITQDVPLESFNDKITRTVPLSTLWADAQNYKEWQQIDINWIKWTVKKIDAGQATIEIDNTQNPFYGKKLAVWLTAEYQWNNIKILEIGKDSVKVQIDNKQNPFYGKKVAAWMEATIPNWEKIKITAVNGDNVEVQTKNTSELAWKTLIFEVQIKAIK